MCNQAVKKSHAELIKLEEDEIKQTIKELCDISEKKSEPDKGK